MEIYTIGFAGKSAEEFFGRLSDAGIKRLLDVRLSNKSQLAGFTKQQDLPFFLTRLIGADYVHEPLLAPTEDLMSGFRKGRISWEEFEPTFHGLLKERKVEEVLVPDDFGISTVLLCSEPTAETCHRRLVAEYLQRHWDDVSIVHL